ncbi:MAG: outer membrane protein assembly factor BamA [Kordiimonadaceae bacterium]|nr:outer membrane protein assembly factor BamA [Kordiimonadaceae bacterium]MBT6033935.1 outer membrane protein assembly factor BamA [Kordiimonadaceae bacterium]
MIFKQNKFSSFCILILALVLHFSIANYSHAQEVNTGSDALDQGIEITEIEITGNQRIEESTIESYLLLNIGDTYTELSGDTSLKRLYNTGLFSDVDIGRRGSVLVVEVSENPIINRIAFEGNKFKNDEDLYEEIQLRPRVVFSRTKVRGDVSRLLEVYRRGGRFAASIEPKVIQLEQNRVNLVFEISEGAKSTIGKINFMGNKVYNNDILRSKMVSVESRWWKFMASEDTYDPDRLNFDKQLLRDFYREQGYADFRVTSAVAELSPDKLSFYINISVEEGELYNFGAISVESEIEELKDLELEKLVYTVEGDQFDSTAIDDSVELLTDVAGLRGYAFVDIRPSVRRNREERTVAITYVINEAPRVYVEEIKIIDNVRTHDKVIRREMRLVEGDAYNSSKLKRSEIRIQSLQFFKEVNIEQLEGTEEDKTILEITVEEQPTGELSVGAGYSSFEGFMVNFSVAERNLLGKGHQARLGATISKRRKQIDFSFTEPFFLNRQVAAGFDVYLRDTNFIESGFRSKAIGGSLRTAFPIAEYIIMSLSYGVKKEEVLISLSSDSPYLAGNSGDFFTSFASFALAFDSLDNRQKPNTGNRAVLTQQFAGIGGNVNYLKTILEYDFYYPIYKHWIFNFNAGAGHTQGMGSKIRINDRFFLGNPRMRGFKESGVGPREGSVRFSKPYDGLSLGGNTYYKATAELFIPLGGGARDLGVEASAYVDAGALFNIDEEDSLISKSGVLYRLLGNSPTPRVSVGIGFSWASPFGPFRIDLAKAIKSEESDEKEFFQFNVGTRF